jgi:hypothetical protein
MKTYVHLWSYLAEFVEWDVSEKSRKKIIFNNFFFFFYSADLWDDVEKYGGSRQATDGNKIRRTILVNQGYSYTWKYVILTCFSTWTMVMRTRFSSAFYTHCLSCVSFFFAI